MVAYERLGLWAVALSQQNICKQVQKEATKSGSIPRAGSESPLEARCCPTPSELAAALASVPLEEAEEAHLAGGAPPGGELQKRPIGRGGSEAPVPRTTQRRIPDP